MNTTNTTTISSKYQVVIPKAVRKSTMLEAGKKVDVVLIDEHHIMLSSHDMTPLERLRRMRGLGKEMWRSLGGTDKYIKNERNSWDR